MHLPEVVFYLDSLASVGHLNLPTPFLVLLLIFQSTRHLEHVRIPTGFLGTLAAQIHGRLLGAGGTETVPVGALEIVAPLHVAL